MGFVFFGLYAAWFVSIFFTPTMLFGYSYIDLFSIMNNDDLEIISQFLNELNLTDGTIKQTATKYVFLSILFSLILLAVIVFLNKLYNYYAAKINRKIKLEKQEIKLRELQIEKLSNPNAEDMGDNVELVKAEDESQIPVTDEKLSEQENLNSLEVKDEKKEG